MFAINSNASFVIAMSVLLFLLSPIQMLSENIVEFRVNKSQCGNIPELEAVLHLQLPSGTISWTESQLCAKHA